MHYIVALGNPGEKYAYTRHNVGWRVAEYFVEKNNLGVRKQHQVAKGALFGGEIAQVPLTVFLPGTSMNRSGEEVLKLVGSGAVEHLLVVHDDVDLPFGQLRVSFGSRANGHNGVASIIARLGTQAFVRLRIGVGRVDTEASRPPSGEMLEQYVLARFTPEEETALIDIIEKAAAVLSTILTEGRLKAKERYGV